MYNGNNAYKLELNTGYDNQRKNTAHAKPKAKAKAKKNPLFLIICVFAIAFLLCGRYVAIYGQGSDITKKRTELAKIQAENSQIQMEIERGTEKNKITEYAINVLGMQKPDKSQYVYITLKKENEMQRAQDSALAEGNGFLGAISGAMTNFVEYLR